MKKKNLKRIYISGWIIFIILVVLSLSLIKNDAIIYDNEYYINNNEEAIIYTLNNDNYLTKTKVYLDNKLSMEEKVKTLLEVLTLNNNKSILLPSYFKPILPRNTKVLSVKLEKNILKVDFSEELLNINVENSEKMIEAIVYTLSSFDIDGIEILVNGKVLEYIPNTKKKLPSILSIDFGINKVYDLVNLNDVTRVFLYYNYEIDDNSYLIPVTKYLNSDKDKINIIVEALTDYINIDNIKSYLSDKLKLDDYKIIDDVMELRFNDEIYEDKVKKKICSTCIDPLLYSVFSNYDIRRLKIYCYDNIILEKERKDIE